MRLISLSILLLFLLALPASAEKIVEITDAGFKPAAISAAVNETITFNNVREKAAAVLFSSKAQMSSPAITAGESWSFAFDEPGNFEYADVIWGFKGTVSVEEKEIVEEQPQITEVIEETIVDEPEPADVPIPPPEPLPVPPPPEPQPEPEPELIDKPIAEDDGSKVPIIPVGIVVGVLVIAFAVMMFKPKKPKIPTQPVQQTQKKEEKSKDGWVEVNPNKKDEWTTKKE